MVPGLREVSFKNNAAHPNAAAVLSACAARKIPFVTLKFAVDVTEAEIVDFLSSNNSSEIPKREFVAVNLCRSYSAAFFETIVEVCRRNKCKSFRIGLAGIRMDLTDEKYSRYVVERNESAALYKFDKIGQEDLPFTIFTGKWRSSFHLNVFQGDLSELSSSLDVANKMSTCRM